MVRVAVVQSSPGADVAVNRDAAVAAVEDAARRGARLVVLPEYSSFFSTSLADAVPHAEPLDGPFVGALQRIAARTGTTVVAGLVEQGDGERFRNTAVAVDGGGVVATYRKVHLYDAFGAEESRWVEPGPIAPPETLLVDGLVCGLQTCFDLRFPESTRLLADAGVEAVLMPADWVPGPRKAAHWRTLVAARAIENTCFVVAADQAAPSGVGASLVVDPAGEVLAELGEDVGIALTELDRAVVARTRTENPALALRRFTVLPR